MGSALPRGWESRRVLRAGTGEGSQGPLEASAEAPRDRHLSEWGGRGLLEAKIFGSAHFRCAQGSCRTRRGAMGRRRTIRARACPGPSRCSYLTAAKKQSIQAESCAATPSRSSLRLAPSRAPGSLFRACVPASTARHRAKRSDCLLASYSGPRRPLHARAPFERPRTTYRCRAPKSPPPGADLSQLTHTRPRRALSSSDFAPPSQLGARPAALDVDGIKNAIAPSEIGASSQAIYSWGGLALGACQRPQSHSVLPARTRKCS